MLLTLNHQDSPLLSDSQKQLVSQLTTQLSPLQQAWLSGYLAASCQQASVDTLTYAAGASAASAKLTLLYGSQTGNSRAIATDMAKVITAQGIAVTLLSMADYSVRQLKNEQWLVVVVSTHGEGEAPDDAIELHQFLGSNRAPKLDGLRYGVIALGDSSYEFFCQTGKDFDERLQKLGASAMLPRLDCDVDYQAEVNQWQQQLLSLLTELAGAKPSAVSVAVTSALSATAFSKAQPYQGQLLLNQKITGRHSSKDIRHIEIDLGESEISYQPGDALGVWFSNDLELVSEIVALGKLDGSALVQVGDSTVSVQQALLTQKELTQLTPATIAWWAQLSESKTLTALSDDKNQLRTYLATHQLADIMTEYPAAISAQALVDNLRALTPRLYSIASSQLEVGSEVHLTVAVVQDDRNGKARFGGASHFLAQSAGEQAIKIYVEANHNFRLPPNPDTKIIMVGPGTGVAPFRAFLQERAVSGVQGSAWLFFGNPHFEQDFLYQIEWQQYLKSGVLSRLDVAFSRDQAEKVYVQHRLLAQGAQVWQWLQEGAHFYVCGDEKRMAKDVHQALLSLVAEHGGLSSEQALQYVDNLRSQKRYQKDVY